MFVANSLALLLDVNYAFPFLEAQYSIGTIPMPVKTSRYHHPLLPTSCKRLTVTLANTLMYIILYNILLTYIAVDCGSNIVIRMKATMNAIMISTINVHQNSFLDAFPSPKKYLSQIERFWSS